MKEYFLRIATRLGVNGVDGFWRLAPWIFLITGLAAVAIAHFWLSNTTHASWHNFLISVGSLLISAGVFSILLKSFQFIQVFRDELLQIFQDERFEDTLRRAMYGHEADNQSLLKAIRLFANLYLDNRCPFGKDAAQLITQQIEDISKDAYYNNFNRTVRITAYDPQTKIIQLSDSVFIDIIPNNPDVKIDYSSSGSNVAGIIDGELLINGTDHTHLLSIVGNSVSYSTVLENCGSYTVERRYQRQFRLPDDPYMHMRLTRSTLNLGIKIENDVADRIYASIKPNGFNQHTPSSRWAIEEKDVSIGKNGSKLSISARKLSLTLTGQGYMIILSER